MTEEQKSHATVGAVAKLGLSVGLLNVLRAREGSGRALARPVDSDAPLPSVAAPPNLPVREAHKEKPTAAHGVKPSGATGVKENLMQLYNRFNDDRVMLVAAGVTFYALLAVFPGIAALVSLFGLFSDANSIQSHLNVLTGILPGGAAEIIGDQIKRIAAKGGGSLGLGFAAGLLTALWSANSGVKAVFDSLNVVYESQEARGFISLTLQSLAFTLGTIVLLIVALGALVVTPLIINFGVLGGPIQWVIQISRWPALLVMVGLALAVLYRYGPSQKDARWRWITPGSAFASIAWLIMSMLFSWYASNFGNFNQTYGTLGAAIGFMTWIWLSTMIVLIGGEINVQIESKTKPDKAAAKSDRGSSRLASS